MSTTEDQIKKLYSSQLASQKEQLQQDYLRADAEYAAEKEKAQKTTDANLTRTAVEAQKSAVNTAELHNAYGLSSGARAQARLAQENQLQANLTALRMQQQELDTDVERQRSLLSQQYQSAIRQAQAENDLAKAEALYEEAKRQQSNLLAQQQTQMKYAYEAAMLMADAGDYTQLVNFYKNQGINMTDADLQLLMGAGTVNVDSETQQPQATVDTPKQSGSRNIGGGSFGVGSTAQPQAANLTVDQSSVDSLGFGPITADTLSKMVEQGIVVEYVENGKIKFRRSNKSGGVPFSTALMPNG